MRTELGKIDDVFFGFGGYDDAMVAFQFQISGIGWGVITGMEGGWAYSKEDVEKGSFKWTHEDRIKSIGEIGWKVIELLRTAKVRRLDELKGKPVRVFFEDQTCRGFEILKEVI